MRIIEGEPGTILKREERSFLSFIIAVTIVVMISVMAALYIFNYHAEYDIWGWVSLGVGAYFLLVAKLSYSSGYEAGYLLGKTGSRLEGDKVQAD